jgi:prepilin-type processing-associated H-X9-DG protein
LNVPRIFWCPADQGNPPPTTINTNWSNADNSAQVSYLYIYLFQINCDNPPDRTEIPSTSSIVEDVWGGVPYVANDWCNHSPTGGNVLFLDGHVKWAPAVAGWAYSNCYYGPP